MDARERLWIVGVAAALTMSVCIAVGAIAGPGDRIYEFLFNRSFVQYVTLSFWALAITLLGFRAWHYLGDRRGLRQRQQGRATQKVKDAAVVGQLDLVRQHLVDDGAAGALRAARRVRSEWARRVRRADELMDFIVCALPACGLFGTVLGLSDSLFVAFSGGVGAEAMPQFLRALSTALDTTVLGLVCAMSAGTVAWLLGRLERQLIDDASAFVRKTLSLDELVPDRASAVGKKERPGRAEGLTATAVLQAELRALTGEIATLAKATFEELLRSSAENYRRGLDDATRKVFSQRQAHEEAAIGKVAAAVADRVGQSVDRLGTLVDRHNGDAWKEFLRQLGKMEKAIRKRVPSEVVVRYERNGQCEVEAENARV